MRLIDENNQMVGVVAVADAIDRARAAGLDLVEVAAESDPPVCRILDFGKYRYEQSKKDKASRQKSKSSEPKEVRLGRSMKIDPHDVQIRLNQARRFLMEGHKVQIVQNFRGREMAFKERGIERMKDIIQALADISRLEMHPTLNGRRMTMMLAPDRPKIDAVRRRAAEQGIDPLPPPVDIDLADDDFEDDIEDLDGLDTVEDLEVGADDEGHGQR